MYVARTPRAGSGSRRSSVSASRSIAPRRAWLSAKRARMSSTRAIPASARRRAATARPSAAVRVACVVTASAGSRRMGPGCASTFRFTKSGTPFACVSARATRTDATFGTDGAGTIFSAPEMCAPPRAARILTE